MTRLVFGRDLPPPPVFAINEVSGMEAECVCGWVSPSFDVIYGEAPLLGSLLVRAHVQLAHPGEPLPPIVGPMPPAAEGPTS